MQLAITDLARLIKKELEGDDVARVLREKLRQLPEWQRHAQKYSDSSTARLLLLDSEALPTVGASSKLRSWRTGGAFAFMVRRPVRQAGRIYWELSSRAI